MTSPRRFLAVAAIATVFATAPAVAQELAVGTWTGTVAPPDELPIDVQYEVSYDDEGALRIAILPPEGIGAPPRLEFRDVMLEEETLTFSWTPGTELTCQLLRLDDGSFEGECTDTDGVPGQLTMVPPADADGER